MEKQLAVNGNRYEVRKLLGKGKGGYSYLVTDGIQLYVLKQIHHEPCDYYQFGDKFESELRDYERLNKTGIRMPKLIESDRDNERILKEYIEGDTIYELVLKERMKESYIDQIKEMCSVLYPAGINIDYFPTNFVVSAGLIYYIDFECNEYSDEWNFENWGVKYWSMTDELIKYASDHNDL